VSGGASEEVRDEWVREGGREGEEGSEDERARESEGMDHFTFTCSPCI
jgi:hypothetical protein